MTTVISFANQKGGVGKTTFSCQLAYYLRLKKRKKVLLIDMDAQGNSTGTLLGDDAFDCTNSEELFEDELSNVRVQKTPRGIDLIATWRAFCPTTISSSSTVRRRSVGV